ncbi:hypothetical protein F4775DRAFT_607254 [Biscogniauxia sp. FL1348]|nr:hypothetical protein F4775DRAFT_607254 [Biscogniauxia sp. FL1348]
MAFSSCFDTNDQSIGPSVFGCGDNFDFTVKFKDVFFSLVPPAIFIALSLWRVAISIRQDVVVDAPVLLIVKLGSIVSYASLELALLILVAIESFDVTAVTIASSSLRFLSALCMIGLSFFDHGRSPRPSILLNADLSLTFLFDIAQVRMYWLSSSTKSEVAYTSIFTASFVIKVVIVVLEAQRKSKWIKWDSKEHSPEETNGIYSLEVYFWLNRLFLEGGLLQLGAAFLAPIVIVILCVLGISVLIKFTGPGQRKWMGGVQKRVGLTTNDIANIKNLKMSGLASSKAESVQNLRVEKLAAGASFQHLVLYAAILAYIPLLGSPFITFAISRRSLDATRLFTSLSYLILMTQPLSQLFQSLPLRLPNATDQCVITNLFSQDLNLFDTELPNSLLNTILAVFGAIGQAAVIATSSPYLAISYPFLVALLYVIQKFYLQTSRQLRLLDLEVKSPLYTHFLGTTKGIITLRAFGFMENDRAKNLDLLDTSQPPAYLLTMIQQWLGVVLNFVVALIALILTSLATQLRSNSGFTGASLVTLMGFGETLSSIVLFYTLLETSIGAISRLKSFDATVETEDRDEEDIIPPPEWPQRGEIVLKGASASYDENEKKAESNLALKQIHLSIQPGEKVAVCGRTGSGKSSLIALLLKLLEPLTQTPDAVYIDNTALRRIDRTALRQRIICIPQDAVFVPDGSTFLESLNPSHVATPGEARSVLEARQLFSLARAALRRRSLGLGGGGSEGGVLLLAEVSSGVDRATERAMQEVIRAEFREYTVLAVSHHLDMIMDFDRVVVMDKGGVVEVGRPVVLAQDSTTRFGELCRFRGK